MLTSSAKAKGRKLQQYVRDKLLEIFPELSDRDVISTPMGVAGEDIWLSEKANSLFPYSVEAKNQEGLNIWDALNKTEQSNRREAGILVFKRNKSKVYCAMDFDKFLELIKKLKELNTK
jgi:hypothetical protein